MADEQKLQEAIEAINSGQRARARELLTRLLRQDQKNVQIWLYMSTVVDTDKERRFCLENVLKYEPGNQVAARGLVLIGATPPDENLTPIQPVNERVWEVGEVIPAAGKAISDKKTLTRMPKTQMISLGVVGLVAAGLVAIGIIGNPFEKTPVTLRPLITAGPTPTYLPTKTPLAGLGPVPTIGGPTPLHYLLNATFTPTPRYIDTPHPESEAFTVGMRNFDFGDYEQAIFFFKQFIQMDPTALDARYYLGMSYYHLEDYEEARDVFRRMITIDDSFAPAHLGVAQSLTAIDPDRAVGNDLFKAVSLDQKYIEAHLARAEFRLLRANPAGVENDSQAILAINPNHAWGYYYRAWALLESGEEEEALIAARRSQTLDPTILENYLVLGHALVENDLVDQALNPLQTYVNFVKDDGFAWFLIGRAYLATGNPQNALDAIETSVEYRQDFYEINYYRGAAYLDLGNYDQAITYLKSATAAYPDWFETYIALSEAYYRSGQVQDANGVVTNVVSLAKTDQQKARLYYWRALTFEELGFLELAERDWKLLLDLPSGVLSTQWLGEASQHLYSLGATPTPSVEVPTSTP